MNPVVVTFTVVSDLYNYKGGIYNSTAVCDSNQPNHAVTVVGYNLTAGYWVLRNSWGPNWGENGHFRVNMEDDGRGACGMYTAGEVGWGGR